MEHMAIAVLLVVLLGSSVEGHHRGDSESKKAITLQQCSIAACTKNIVSCTVICSLITGGAACSWLLYVNL